MEENEMLEQTSETENVETQTTEENVEGIELTDTTDKPEANATSEEAEKTEVRKSLRELLESDESYQAEFSDMLKGRLDRQERKHQKELTKLRDTEMVLRTTLNLKEDDDVNAEVRKYYESEGIKLPEPLKEDFNEDDYVTLGERDAEKVLKNGIAYAEEEASRLADIGYKNLNARDRAAFNKLAETLTYEKNRRSLLELGAKEELINDKSFIDFRSKFNSNVPIKEVYEMFLKNTSQKTVKENPGSMKNSDVSIVKDYYTPEEISKLTDEQLDDPKIYAAVRNSMTKNYKENYYE